MNTENWIAIKERDILISADRAGTGFIPPIKNPEPGSLADLAIAFLCAVMNRSVAKMAMDNAIAMSDSDMGQTSGSLMSMHSAMIEFQDAVNTEIKAGLTLSHTCNGMLRDRDRAMEEVGYTAPWMKMYSLANEGDDPFAHVTLRIQPGDEITVVRNGYRAIYRIARNGKAFDLPYPAGGHFYREIIRTRC